MKMIFLITLSLLLVFFESAFASFDLGSTDLIEISFDCPADVDSSAFSGGAFPSGCDANTQALEMAGTYATTGCNSVSSQLLSVANYSGGAGGRGWRQWVSYDDAAQNETAGFRFRINTAITTGFYARWYFRANVSSPGAVSNCSSGKTNYYYNTNDDGTHFSFEHLNDGYQWNNCGSQSGSDYYQTSEHGWSTITSTTGYDQNWHRVDMHYSISGSDITVHYWIDGQLMAVNTWTNTCSPTNLSYLQFYTQMRNNTECFSIDTDDMVFAGENYPGLVAADDGQGGTSLQYIGAYGATPQQSQPAKARVDRSPSGVTIEFCGSCAGRE